MGGPSDGQGEELPQVVGDLGRGTGRLASAQVQLRGQGPWPLALVVSLVVDVGCGRECRVFARQESEVVRASRT